MLVEDILALEQAVNKNAGAAVNLISELFVKSNAQIGLMQEALEQQLWADAQFYGYTAVVESCKVLLKTDGYQTNPNDAILNQFEEVYIATGKIAVSNFEELSMITLIDRAKDPVSTYAQEVIAFYGQILAYETGIRLQKKIRYDGERGND